MFSNLFRHAVLTYMIAKTFRALIVTGIIAEVGLLLVTISPISTPTRAFLLPLGFICAAIVILVVTLFVDRQRQPDWVRSLPITAQHTSVPKKALAFLVSELQLLMALAGVFSSPRTAEGERSYGYSKTLRVIVFAVLALSIVEIIVVHLAVTNRFWRVTILVVSIYSVALLAGFYTAMRRTPHTISPTMLSIRQGLRFTCQIPHSNIKSITPCSPGDGGNINVDSSGETRVPVFSAVNLKVTLHQPVQSYDLHLGTFETSQISFFCDNQKEFLAAASKDEASP